MLRCRKYGLSSDKRLVESWAVLDLSELDDFTFSTWDGTPTGSFSSIGIGTGNTNTSEQNGVSGKLILGNTTTIDGGRSTNVSDPIPTEGGSDVP